MQNFKRKITYFYEYNNGMVGSTAGFMKLEIRGDRVKIIVNIQEPIGIPYKGADLYLYHEAGDHLSAIKVDTIHSIDGVLTYQNRTEWQNIFQTDRDLYTFDGVAVVYNDGHYYIGDFNDRNRSEYDLVKKEKKPTIAKMVPVIEDREEENKITDTIIETEEMNSEKEGLQKQDVQDNSGELVEVAGFASVSDEKIKESQEEEEPITACRKCPYQKKRKEQKEHINAFEEMIEKYPKLPMYGVTELFDCVRIHPRDIGKLDMRNWKLGVNSFLTHSFYTYQYLLLGKMRLEDGTDKEVIGVPGVYSNRERYLAGMFGFEKFIPVKQTGIKTGEFGYWIVELMPML